MKLSPAQRKLLIRLSKGDVVMTTGGVKNYAFFAKDNTQVRFDTLTALSQAGLVLGELQSVGTDYRITEAGRAALTEQ